MTRDNKYILFLFVAILTVLPLIGFGILHADVRVSWDANTEDDLAGYIVYYGREPNIFDQSVIVGNVTSVVLPVCGDSAANYIFAVTAYDFSGNESGFSERVSIFVNNLIFCGQKEDTFGNDTRVISLSEVEVSHIEFNWKEITPVITSHENEQFIDGVWQIYGHIDREIKDAGLYIANLGKDKLKLTFIAWLAGIQNDVGDCYDREREFLVDTQLFFIGVEPKNFEVITETGNENIFINFIDDCWVAGRSDANLYIKDIKVYKWMF